MLERLPTPRVLLLFFGYLARSVDHEFEGLQRDIRGARMATTHHGYLARTLLYAAGSFVTLLAFLVVFTLVYVRPATLRSIGQPVLTVGLMFPAAAVSFGVYRLRLYWPRYIADERARQIEFSMPNVTNFLLALSRAGVPASASIEVLSAHADVLGEAADELRYAWRDMTYFGADVASALTYLSDTTRLDELSDFLDGYLRALTGRGDVDRYLERAMDDLFEKAEIEQEDFLSTLGVLAEVYVAVFVAFPIFTLIILIVMGFIGAPDVLTTIRVVVYAVVPLTAFGFLVFLETIMTNPLAAAGRHRPLETNDRYDQSLWAVSTREPPDDERVDIDMTALDRYRTKQELVRFVQAPLTLLRRQPIYALYVGIGLGALYLGLRLGLGVLAPATPFAAPLPTGASTAELVRIVDRLVVEAVVIALALYGVFYEFRSRYLAGVERELPQFLNELAHRHQMGMALSESIVALRERDMGLLDDEVERMARDFRLNAVASNVLRRFANRVRSSVVTRIVVLLTAANEAADRLDPVIDALAARAELTHRLKRERQIEMSLYVVIIYVSYLVFLGILIILHDVFLPQIPTTGSSAGIVTAEFDVAAYETVFFHMSVIQGVFSGFVGGKMSEGEVSAGVKHALVMVVAAYIVFTLLLPNVTIAV